MKSFIETHMPDENLLKYIKDGLAQGRTEDVIRPLLLSAGWAQKDIDDAFAFVDGAPAGSVAPVSTINNVVQEQVQHQPQFQPQRPPSSKTWRWITAGILVLVIVLIGGWLAYAAFMNPSPQQVLDAMFQNGFSNITSIDNDTQISVNIHIVPASTTASSTFGMQNGINPYAGMLLGGSSSDLSLQAEGSGTVVFVSDNDRDVDQNFKVSVNAGQAGQSMTFALGGDFRSVDGVVYLNLSAVPNVGFFDPSTIEGKWIELQADSSTLGLAQNLSGNPSLTIPSTTISAADIQKIESAAEQAITITKTLSDESIGGVPNYHYQYVINKQGVQNAVLAAATVAAHSFGATSTTLDASTTDAITMGTSEFLGAFTAMGGELWIGTSDHYPHQTTLQLAFSTSTPYGTISGTINVTSTLTNINGGQVISAPAGAEDFQTLMQSALSSAPAGSALSGFGASQVDGRDARRISDLHEIQNALELYYNKCGYYPGAAVPSGQCPFASTQISTFAELSNALRGTVSLGITSIPNDPTTGAMYYYGTNTVGSKYIIAARLENKGNSVFSYYTPLSLVGIKIPGVTSCAAPMYCLSL